MASFKKVRLKSGQIRYRFWVRLGGFSSSRRFATKKAGENWARETEAAILDGSYQAASSLRVPDLFKLYIQRVVSRWETAAEKEADLLLRER